MSELHWTGAVVLLGLVVMCDRTTRPRPATILSWDEFARERGLEPEPREATGEAPTRGRRAWR